MIPDYQTAMLPLLRFLANGDERTSAECRESTVETFSVTPEEALQLLPSGRTPLLSSRVHWAKTYLEKAGLVESPRRGVVRITPRGIETLASNPASLKTGDLAERFVEMREWLTGSRKTSDNEEAISIPAAVSPLQEDLSPDESLAESFRRYRTTVEADVIDRVKQMSPAFFEKLVVDLLVALGYGGPFGTGLRTGRSGDHGIDGVIYQDKLGLDLLYIQAKRWEGSVGGSVVREFAGALSAHRARKGVIITTSTFTRDAIEDANRMGERIVLIDGLRLAELMYESGLGLAAEETFTKRRIDSDYFAEE